MRRHDAIRCALGFVSLVGLVGCAIVDDGVLPGAPCASDRDCGAGQTCAADGGGGTCVPSAIVDEPPVGCGGKAEGDACSDGDGCTDDDRCIGGSCVGTPRQCSGADVCSGGVCVDLGQCTLAGVVSRVTTTGRAVSPAIAYDADRDDLAVVFDDDVSGISEIYFQVLAIDGTTLGPAIQLTNGEADANGITHPSFDPAIVYNPDQKEFGVLFAHVGGILGITGDATAMTVTAAGIPAPAHQLTVTESAESLGIAWTGATYGAAWVSGLTNDAGENLSVVEMAPLHDDASKIGFNNKSISVAGARAVAVAFNPRTASFGIAYRLDGSPGSLVLTTTNVDGDATVDTVIPTSADPFDPALAITPVGFALAWHQDLDVDGLGAVAVAQVSDGLVPSAARVVTDAGEQCGRPALAAVANGLALAYAAGAPTALEVHMRVLGGDVFAGGAAGPARTVGSGQRPSAAALPTGVGLVFLQATTDTSDLFASTQCLVP